MSRNDDVQKSTNQGRDGGCHLHLWKEMVASFLLTYGKLSDLSPPKAGTCASVPAPLAGRADGGT